MDNPIDSTTREDLLAEIEKIRQETEMKVKKITAKLWREAHLKISEYEAELECFNLRGHMGFCHSYWPVRKRILKEKYNISWRTPAENNPGIIFD